MNGCKHSEQELDSEFDPSTQTRCLWLSSLTPDWWSEYSALCSRKAAQRTTSQTSNDFHQIAKLKSMTRHWKALPSVCAPGTLPLHPRHYPRDNQSVTTTSFQLQWVVWLRHLDVPGYCLIVLETSQNDQIRRTFVVCRMNKLRGQKGKQVLQQIINVVFISNEEIGRRSSWPRRQITAISLCAHVHVNFLPRRNERTMMPGGWPDDKGIHRCCPDRLRMAPRRIRPRVRGPWVSIDYPRLRHTAVFL